MGKRWAQQQGPSGSQPQSKRPRSQAPPVPPGTQGLLVMTLRNKEGAARQELSLVLSEVLYDG
jgi:hypothetical protein